MTMFIYIHTNPSAYNFRNEFPLIVFYCNSGGDGILRTRTGNNHTRDHWIKPR